ncbi:DUF1353 domain-containing protein [Roseateles sp.]|uniref:DUF1353 domain-containing protein n=1 Tax=Roseateles sp. TaxID=1971397 RepID=UPI0039EC9F43
MQIRWIAVALLALAVGVAHAQYGKYSGAVETVWPPGETRYMVLLKDFSYEDPTGAIRIAPKGWRIDGASIPRWAWSFVGDPYGGAYRYASVFHDYACDRKERPWESVHLAFYYGMLVAGVDGFKAKLMYAAAYLGGPRWEMTKKVGSARVSPGFKASAKRLGPDSMEAQVFSVVKHASDITESSVYTAPISDLQLDSVPEGDSVMVQVAMPPQASLDPRTIEQLKAIIKSDSSLKQVEEAAEALRRK